MTTAEDLRLVLSRAVADPPPLSPSLASTLAQAPRVRPAHQRRNRFLAGVVVAGAAAAAAAAFSAHGPPANRPGLGRYTARSIADMQHANGQYKRLPDSNAEVVVVMEVRYSCQNVYRYLDGPHDLAARSELRSELRSSDRVVGTDISAFTAFARSRLADSVSTGSVAPLRDFASSECPSRYALRHRIRRGGP